MVFDGMDWQTTQAAAIYRSASVGYREGRGAGLHFQDYRGTNTDFGYFVASPHNAGTLCDVDQQTLKNPGGELRGGYDWRIAGDFPWSVPEDLLYLIGKSEQNKQAYPDSAATATALCSGTKTYNDSINFDPLGRQVVPLARDLQKQGFAVGVVTSVPFSHATPACAYANNVHRDDYQDPESRFAGLAVDCPSPATAARRQTMSCWEPAGVPNNFWTRHRARTLCQATAISPGRI